MKNKFLLTISIIGLIGLCGCSMMDKVKINPEESIEVIKPWEDENISELIYCSTMNWNCDVSEFLSVFDKPDSINYDWGLITYNNCLFFNNYKASAELILDDLKIARIESIVNLDENSNIDTFYEDLFNKLKVIYSSYEVQDIDAENKVITTETSKIEITQQYDKAVFINFSPNEILDE